MEAIVETAPSANVEATTGHEPSAWDEPSPWREVFEEVAAGRREALARLYDLAKFWIGSDGKVYRYWFADEVFRKHLDAPGAGPVKTYPR